MPSSQCTAKVNTSDGVWQCRKAEGHETAHAYRPPRRMVTVAMATGRRARLRETRG